MPVSAAIILFAAPALGPAVGGLLISATGWRGVFLINVPIGIGALAAVFAGRRAVPGGAGDRGARLDVPGLLVLGAGLGLATYGASQGPAHGWLSAASAPAWAGGLVLVTAYVLRERAMPRDGEAPRDGTAGRRRPPAAVSLGPLRTPARALTLALACVTSVVLFSVLFLAPVFLQQIQHRSTTVTGLVLLPQGVVMGLASWLGSEIIKRGQARPALITASVSGGLALLAASTLGLLWLTPSTPAWATTALLCGRGVALGLTVQPLVMAFLAGLRPSRMPDANTLFNMAERLSGSFGIALLATLYASRAALSGSAVTAFRDCAIVLTGAAAAGALAALALPWRRGPVVAHP